MKIKRKLARKAMRGGEKTFRRTNIGNCIVESESVFETIIAKLIIWLH